MSASMLAIRKGTIDSISARLGTVCQLHGRDGALAAAFATIQAGAAGVEAMDGARSIVEYLDDMITEIVLRNPNSFYGLHVPKKETER